MSTSKKTVKIVKSEPINRATYFILQTHLSMLEELARRDLVRPEADVPDARGAFILKERAEAKLEVIQAIRERLV